MCDDGVCHFESIWVNLGQLGKGNKYPNVEIDGFHSEVLSSTMYDSNPIPDLEIYNCRSKNDIANLKLKYKIDQKIKIKIGLARFFGIWRNKKVFKKRTLKMRKNRS